MTTETICPPCRNVRASTPWGTSDQAYTYRRGIIRYCTPGHGGFHVANGQNLIIPESLRNPDGWYEEDCEYNKVFFFLGRSFDRPLPEVEIDKSRDAIRDWFPYQWEQYTGEKVPASDSHVVADDEFAIRHANDYVGIAAWGSWHKDVPDGKVGVCASIGGKRGGSQEKYFLVPEEEYDARDRRFVIDLQRHQEISSIR